MYSGCPLRAHESEASGRDAHESGREHLRPRPPGMMLKHLGRRPRRLPDSAWNTTHQGNGGTGNDSDCAVVRRAPETVRPHGRHLEASSLRPTWKSSKSRKSRPAPRSSWQRRHSPRSSCGGRWEECSSTNARERCHPGHRTWLRYLTLGLHLLWMAHHRDPAVRAAGCRRFHDRGNRVRYLSRPPGFLCLAHRGSSI